MHSIRMDNRQRGIMLVEMLCVVGLFCTIMLIVSPLLRDLIITIPRAQRIADEQDTFIGQLADLRTYISNAERITLSTGQASLQNADGSSLALLVQSDSLILTEYSPQGGGRQLCNAEFAYTRPELTPYPPGADKPLAMRLQLSVIAHRQPEKVTEPLNIIFCLKEGQYVSK
ncbi:MAG: type II secretion system protein [Sedimentisphaerales bacterium]|nr:type II secretion system protein [Sedimentisphaerales bacterium]MBN2842737.1 type II secretion system protein [Sedimentisphaerales bacterium]